jgi:CheY-like chemotaxis protein
MKHFRQQKKNSNLKDDVLRSPVTPSDQPPGFNAPISERHLRSGPRRRSSKLLVVDDDEDHRDAFAALLESWGYQVNLAESGKRALELAHACRPDIAFIDLRMPGMSGYKLAASLRAAMGSNCSRLFAVSGSIDRSDRRNCLFDRLFEKPIDPRLMREILRELVEAP